MIIRNNRWNQQSYICKCSLKEITKTRKLKLNMVDIADNYGEKTCCKSCKADPQSFTKYLRQTPVFM